MKNILAFLLISGLAFAEEKYQIPKGFKQATVSNKVVIHDMYLKDMKDGDKVRTLEDYVVIDEENHVWLKPTGIGFSVNGPEAKIANIEISKSRLGWFVHIPYRYKVINGYSVPFHSQWRAVSKAPSGYIPVLGARVIEPVYEEPSAFRKRSMKMHGDYEASFKKPQMPPNPYEMEKSNDNLQPFISPGFESEPRGISSPAAPVPLPELESEPRPITNSSIPKKGYSKTAQVRYPSVSYFEPRRTQR